ncbi:hypothetical protein ATCV1_z603L [Acanthocystis turfacea chlorella virus 1]|uniref:Uncharacterized protein z603L n=1 Tax=Chlorovirus heliozoae TaxID=322019 RepID=A7K9L3_9PHYC|nr:hypothetical protein ATCV1_z603L [Acanthocystis turfacea chlorella virus 1]ABT16737.1 hypothetical protein ATCV1_z603L [Acanthocystis turfacea chlorella virus 1]
MSNPSSQSSAALTRFQSTFLGVYSSSENFTLWPDACVRSAQNVAMVVSASRSVVERLITFAAATGHMLFTFATMSPRGVRAPLTTRSSFSSHERMSRYSPRRRRWCSSSTIASRMRT